MRLIRTVDCHVGGHVVRVVVDGVPGAKGTNPAERAAWFKRHADDLRRALVLAPRGHADITAVALTEPSSPGAHAGLLFMDGGGYPRLVAGSVVAAASVCLDRQPIVTGDGGTGARAVRFDTMLGQVTATVGGETARDVTVTLGPAFVLRAATAVLLGTRRVPVDVAFGGGVYAIADSEALGVPLDRAHVEGLRRAGLALCAEVEKRVDLTYPGLAGKPTLDGVVLTGPPANDDAHLRGAVISRTGVVDQSALSGSAAVMAVLDAMGIAVEGQSFVHEGISGMNVTGTVVRRTSVGDVPAIELDVASRVWVVGDATWVLHDDDPLRHGYPTDQA
jgi:proline racemase